MTGKLRMTVLLPFMIMLISGCSADEAGGSGAAVNDGYDDVREAAWNFLEEQGWADTANEESRETAEVSEVTATDAFEYTDKSFIGQDVLRVSFEEDENAMAAVTELLVDPETNEVIGYMPGE